jgi:hypothetical protein
MTVRVAAPGGAKGGADVIDKRSKTAAQRLAPSHQHVIVIPFRLKRRGGAQGLFQPSPDTIAPDRVPDVLGHGQAHASARLGLVRGASPTARL